MDTLEVRQLHDIALNSDATKIIVSTLHETVGIALHNGRWNMVENVSDDPFYQIQYNYSSYQYQLVGNVDCIIFANNDNTLYCGYHNGWLNCEIFNGSFGLGSRNCKRHMIGQQVIAMDIDRRDKLLCYATGCNWFKGDRPSFIPKLKSNIFLYTLPTRKKANIMILNGSGNDTMTIILLVLPSKLSRCSVLEQCSLASSSHKSR